MGIRFNDATLMAFADGDLSPADAARVQLSLAEDPDLAARVQRFRAVRTALRTVYDSVAAEPIPENLRALLGDVASSERPAPPAPPAPPSHRAILPATAIASVAAALIIGVIAGRLSVPAPALVEMKNGALHASKGLTRVLDTQLAAESVEGDAVRVGVSFRGHDGAWCRTFRSDAMSGLACWNGDAWTIRVFEAAPESDEIAAPGVLAMVNGLIEGEPVSASEERAARDQHWPSSSQ